MHDGEEKKGSFVVKDNRRFDTEGNERDSASRAAVEVKRTPPVSADLQPAPPTLDESDDGEPQEGQSAPAIDFSSFIISLGTQALMQLGVIKAPQGVELPVDKEAARQTIEILSMLEKKTAGNLDPAEAQLLEEVLHNCRLGFVRAG